MEAQESSQAEPSGLAGGDRAACQQAVMSFFPDICPQHFAKVAADFQWCPEQIITHVLDQQEQGIAYPKRGSVLKRKRPDTEVDGEEKKVDHLNHPIGRDSGFIKTYTRATKILLQHSFPQVYVADIDRLMKDNNCMAYASHLAIEKALLNEQPESALKTKKITAVSKGHDVFQALTRHEDEATVAAVAHWTLAKDHCQGRHDKIAAGRQREREELENVSRARAEGTMSECGCCFDSFPLNRMVHCDGQGMHWFCRDCVKRMAENQIGDSKYELACMSMDGCDASFSHEQRSLFLDEKATQALDRIEQESVLRMAGIENLATCPFCPFAAEYPPVEENREFRCLNPECAVVSCRHCRQETHVPKTCEEAAREVGHSARHAIEEAMSQALIRRCNKCSTPFIKEHGCNKMTCTRPGCRNIQCYVCSQSCEYSHFDDAGRGGKNGNCPLFDSVEERHEAEVKEAEDKARKLVAEQNPDISPDMFQIAFSDKVKADEQRRKNDNPGPRMPHAYPPPFMDLNRDNLNLLGARQQLEAARQQLAAQQLAARQQLEAARQQLVAQQQLAAQQLAAQQARQQAAQQARQQAAQQAAEQQAAQHEVAAQRLLAVRQAVFPVEHHHFFYQQPNNLPLNMQGGARPRLALEQQQENLMLRRAQMAQMAQEHARLHAPVHKAMVEAAKARKPSALLQAKVEAQAKAGVAVQNARQWNQARAGAQQATLEAQKMGDVGAVPAQQLPHHQPDNVAPHPGYHELEADMLGDWEDWDGWEQPEQKPNVNAAVQHNQPGLRMAGLPVGWSPQNGAILQEPVLQNGENFTGLHGFIENNRHQGARHDIIDLTGDDDAADHVHAMNPFAPRVHPAVNFYYGLGGLGKGVGNPA